MLDEKGQTLRDDTAWTQSTRREEKTAPKPHSRRHDFVCTVFRNGFPGNIMSMLMDGVRTALDPTETSMLLQQDITHGTHFSLLTRRTSTNERDLARNTTTQCLNSLLEDKQHQGVSMECIRNYICGYVLDPPLASLWMQLSQAKHPRTTRLIWCKV